MWWRVTKTTVRHQNCSPTSPLTNKRAKCWVKGGVGGQLHRIIGPVQYKILKKLTTYASPNLRLTFISYLGQNVELGDG